MDGNGELAKEKEGMEGVSGLTLEAISSALPLSSPWISRPNPMLEKLALLSFN